MPSLPFISFFFLLSRPVDDYPPPPSGVIDWNRYLVGSLDGSLHLLALTTKQPSSRGGEEDDEVIDQIVLQRLGETSIPQSLSYLDKGYVFVGSMCGDCQLIRLASGEERRKRIRDNQPLIEVIPSSFPSHPKEWFFFCLPFRPNHSFIHFFVFSFFLSPSSSCRS